MIKTSVIIPIYNTAPYLEECIESVFKQTQHELEVIAVNDGSTDNSQEVLMDIKKKHPELIIISQQNQGLGAARNVGIENARGEYIYFLDSDDYIHEDTLEVCYKCASENTLDVVLFDAFAFEDSAEKLPVEPNPYDRHETIESNVVFAGVDLMKKYYQEKYVSSACLIYCSLSFLRRHRIEFLRDVYFEDNEFHCKIMILAKRVMYIPRMFYQRRCRNDSIMGTSYSLKKAEDHLSVINQIADLRNLNNGDGKNIIKKICLNSLMYLAKLCNENDIFRQKKGLSKQIFNLELALIDLDIEKIEEMEDIYHINRLCEYFLPMDLCKEKQQINLRRRQLLKRIFNSLPLKNSNDRVAIYGCGNYTEKLLNSYEECIGDIQADIIFLVTFIEDDGLKYKGFPVYNIKSINEEKVDYILVSSPQYEKEMCDMVYKVCNDKIPPLILLYGELKLYL